MKKLLALLLCGLLLLTLVSCGDDDTGDDDLSGYVEEEIVLTEEKIGKDTFYFDYVDSETVYLTGYDGPDAMHELSIPEKLGGKTLVKIGVGALNNQSALSKVILPETVTEIGDFAFGNCAGLTTVIIPASVEKIGIGCFYGCGASSVSFPENGSLTEIPYAAFMNCAKLQTLNIPSYIKTVDKAAFFGCEALAELTLAEGVEVIEQQAFQNCKELATVNFPTTLQAIVDYAFAGCSSLYVEGIHFDETGANAAFLTTFRSAFDNKPITSDGEN